MKSFIYLFIFSLFLIISCENNNLNTELKANNDSIVDKVKQLTSDSCLKDFNYNSRGHKYYFQLADTLKKYLELKKKPQFLWEDSLDNYKFGSLSYRFKLITSIDDTNSINFLLNFCDNDIQFYLNYDRDSLKRSNPDACTLLHIRKSDIIHFNRIDMYRW